MISNMPEKAQGKITPVQQMVSSCTGAIITALFVTPLDVVKIRLQAQQKDFAKNRCFLYCNGLMDHICYCFNGGKNHNGRTGPHHHSRYWYQRPGHFTGTLVSLPHHLNGTVDAFVKITRNEGLASLWSGLPPTLVMAVPATVVYFTLYDQLKELLNSQLKYTTQPMWIPVTAGALARVIAVSVISPLELVRTKMQSARLTYEELGRAVRGLVSQHGLLSVWRGWGPTILRDVPFSSIYWACYEYQKHTYRQEQPTFTFSLAAGAVSGTVAAVLTTPFDVVKTHRQIELGELDVLQAKKKFIPTYQLIGQLYRERGVTALFSGIVPRVIKVAPACAVMISTYEFGKAFFRQHNLIVDT